MSTGKIIRELREKSELEQEQLAELAGVSRTIVRLWEQDKNCPSVANFEKVLNVLGYTLYVRPKTTRGRYDIQA